MNIFAQENFNGVQEVINTVNGQRATHTKKEIVQPVRDEISELNQQSQHIQELIEEIDSLPNIEARELMQECMQEVLSFYGHGLERILKIISNGNTSAAKDIYNSLIDDSFVSSLLLIHDLHPLDLKTRLYQALDKVKPYMDSHGGSVEIVSLENGVAKLKLSGSCKSCPSSSSTLELGIKQAIEENCPDLLGLEVEGVVESAHPGKSSLTEIGWRVIKGLDDLKNGSMKSLEIPGVELIVCRVNNKLFAYRNLCPACDRSFSNGTLEEKILGCQMGHRYDVQRAGICTDDPDLHLDPFPLIEDGGVIKISIG
jgi:Fe-S cluster biogenesis protein NfuA/nitrite reductase/ring-hydroxylating ferredoxin subunit